jgi:hypothetical protein
MIRKSHATISIARGCSSQSAPDSRAFVFMICGILMRALARAPDLVFPWSDACSAMHRANGLNFCLGSLGYASGRLLLGEKRTNPVGRYDVSY